MNRPLSERWRSGIALLVSVVVLAAIVLWAPTDGPAGLRRLLGIGDERLGDPADVPDGGTHAFLVHQPGNPDEPVAWDPCDEIHYEINPDGAPYDPEETEEFVADAVEVVAHYTGLSFVYDGRTDRRPEWDRAFVPSIGRHEPVLIAWATESEVPQLEDDVAGVGGAIAVEVNPGGWLRFVSGGVTLDADAFEELDSVFDGDGESRAILLHELGHLVGLDHVGSPDELMFADNVGKEEFGIGDLNGLVRLGEGRCA